MRKVVPGSSAAAAAAGSPAQLLTKYMQLTVDLYDTTVNMESSYLSTIADVTHHGHGELGF